MTQTEENKIFSAICLATKAGKTRLGTDAVRDAVRAKRACLVMIAGDLSDNTKKLLINCCTHYQIKYQFFSDKETIGKRVGRDYCAAVAIMDPSFAKMLNGGVKSC